MGVLIFCQKFGKNALSVLYTFRPAGALVCVYVVILYTFRPAGAAMTVRFQSALISSYQ